MTIFTKAELSIINEFSIEIGKKLYELSAPLQAIQPVLNVLQLQVGEFKLLGVGIESFKIVSFSKTDEATSIIYDAVTEKKEFKNNVLGFSISSPVHSKPTIH